MGKQIANGRCSSKLNDYRECHPYHTYARYTDYRNSSGNQAEHKVDDSRLVGRRSAHCSRVDHKSHDGRSTYCRSTDCLSADARSVNHHSHNRRHRPANHWSTGCRHVDHRSDESKSASHWSNVCRSADHDSVDHRQSKQRSVNHISVKPRRVEHSTTYHSSSASSSVDHRLSEHNSTESKTADLHSVEDRIQSQSPNEQFTDFPSSEESAKCHLMKVLQQVGKPYLKQLLLHIVKDKNKSETLESYAMKRGMDNTWLKKNNFTEEQISNIRQNPNCDNFDLTLIFKCIEVFKIFNSTILKIENDDTQSYNCIKYIKDIRNNLCHNRNDLTVSQWYDKAKSLKSSIRDLLVIIHYLDEEMDINSESMKIGEEVDRVMNEDISENEFRYMRLLKVINSTSAAVLNNITQCIYHDKKEDNFNVYFLRKGMTPRTYKDTFYKEEKLILENKSEGIQPDLTLHCKVIEVCKTFHPLMKDNTKLVTEFITILKEIRGIRNHVTHKMLEMSSNECNMVAQKLGDSLQDLVNLIHNSLNIPMDAAKINIININSDISSIMAVPYPF